ncbi:MAG: HAD family hydrolase [Bacilli bacterium]|nr:HAD family hydrolase [Bacilli bacterium]
MQFSTYLFDFDGTLCDTRESLVPVFRAGFERVGVHATPEDCERWMHLNLYQTLVQSGIPEEQYQTVVDGILDALDMPESIALIKPFEDTVSTLQALLDSGKRIGIVSNNTSTHIRLVLHEMGIDIPFDCIVGSDMFSHGKPHPEPIEVALRMMGLEANDQVCYVGDSLQDPECGINAGIGGILLDRESVHADFVGNRVATLSELLD